MLLLEKDLNYYYNKGRFNHPSKIGYMMKMIRELRPITEDEWRIWYLEHVHDADYLQGLAKEMCHTIPDELHASVNQCRAYIYDVMFHRTFQGYNKEKLALQILQNVVSADVQEAPENWDTQYFIDFYVRGANGQLIGIQLKPETFYKGGYQNVVNIEGKMAAFRHQYNALTYILIYKQSTGDSITFLDRTVIDEIKHNLDQ